MFAAIDGLYVGKVIRVTAGESLSLQYHRAKIETISVISGNADVEYGSSDTALLRSSMGPGDTIHLPAGVLHRIRAIDDLVFAEVSTAHAGWETDVVRLDDQYGRTGTSAP